MSTIRARTAATRVTAPGTGRHPTTRRSPPGAASAAGDGLGGREVALAVAPQLWLKAGPPGRVDCKRIGVDELDVRALLGEVGLHLPHQRLSLLEVDQAPLLLPPGVVGRV